MSDATNGSPEELLRNRFASGEIDAVEDERSLKTLKGERSIAKGRSKARLLAVGIATVALLAVGGWAVYAQGQESPMMGGDATKNETDGNGMGGMMDGGQMGSMMRGQGGMGSMVDGGGMSGGMMGSFDEEQSFDLQFIDQMTMHHEGAIMSSEHMISDSERPELRQLAENIQQSQSEQIEQMQEWRGEWYGDAGQTSGMPTGMMDQMMGDGMMKEMMGGSMQEMMGGDATDEMFLRMMIPHHQLGIEMAKQALEEAEHPELKELAQSIIDEQSAEIELMQGYLDEIEASTGGQEGPMMGGTAHDNGEAHHEH